MTFSEAFTQHLIQYHLTIADLSRETGISKSMLSRMKNGKKEPTADSELLSGLAMGIATLAKRSGKYEADFCIIKESLQQSLQAQESFDIKFIVNNLNLLINSLDFRVSDLSHHLSFDASYLSLIRAGKRTPSNIAGFCSGIADFISAHYEHQLTLLSSVLGCSQEDIVTRSSRKEAVYKWLTKHSPQEDSSTLHFIQSLDSFNLSEYINAVHLNDNEIFMQPSMPSVRKNYYLPEGFMQAELTWLQAVITSPSISPVLFYSDMPIGELSRNVDFSKQWMMSVAMMLKKGIHLNMIHQIDRQKAEMMLGLEAWIPLYMTGQVSPYYLKNNQTPYFHHFLRISDVAALSGEAIEGFFENGCYHFTQSKEEIAYYNKKGENLLSKALPLMEIYRKENMKKYHCFLDTRMCKGDEAYRNILCTPPIYTISPELLSRILTRNNAPAQDIEIITAYAQKYQQWAKKVTSSATLTDELSVLNETEFHKRPVALPLSDLFIEKEYTYTYDEYLAHLKQSESFAQHNTGYTLSLSQSCGFCNIQIRIVEGKFVIISKQKAPTIHFVIHHPKLRSAIENLTIPIIENEK